MSGGHPIFKLTEDDAMKLLVCESHIGTKKLDFQMEPYLWKRRPDGVHIIQIRNTWEKLLFAARAIAAIQNPSDVVVVSAQPIAQRAVLKFAAHIGATPIVGRFTPGSLTNQIQKNFKEPRLLVVSDPQLDHQAVSEASYVNTPVIAFANTDSPLKFVDIAIPSNLKHKHSVGLMWWLLAREVLLLRGKISRATGFRVDDKEIMPDLYFHRDPQEAEKEAEQEAEVAPTKDAWPTGGGPGMDTTQPDYGDQSAEPIKLGFDVPHITDWAAASDWATPAAEPPQQVVMPSAPQPQAIAPPQQQQAEQPKPAQPQGEWASNTGNSSW